MANLIPYLNFPGNTAEAMEFYHSIFGGEYGRSTFGEYGVLPEDDPNADKTMHAQLVSEQIRFMAADAIPGFGPDVNYGNNISMALVGPEQELLGGWFERLSEGGTVIMPLAKQVWGDVYGAVTDRFGITWMVNIDTGESAAATRD